ncbi:hypothetical protein ACFPYI_14210 [Halomarina salina]|uniref:Cox cluster protein n=1 Tax=Halomarina salina TaxID=1872699 RepID=A0ABD5RQE2_9EURY|nr:hypothetical protein [Halomarina salina]
MAEEATGDAADSGPSGGGRSNGGRSSSGGYVHDPSNFPGGQRSDTGGDGDGGDGGDGPRTTRAYHPEVPQSEEFGARGWLLVAALFVAFVCIPVVILLVPYSEGVLQSLGLTWRDAYLTLPLLPALVLAALAVWVAVSD